MIEVANSVGLTDDKAPLLMSAFMLACFALSLPAGLLVEKAKVKHAIALAACFSAAGSGVGSYAGSATVLLISRGLEGAGFVLMCIAIPVAVSTYVNPKDLGLVMGICSVWISLGSILAYKHGPAAREFLQLGRNLEDLCGADRRRHCAVLDPVRKRPGQRICQAG
jgi:MFS family permease